LSVAPRILLIGVVANLESGLFRIKFTKPALWKGKPGEDAASDFVTL